MIAIISAQFEGPGQSISGWVAAVMIAFTIPAVLFGAMAGVFVDRWRKKPVLVISNLLRGGLVIALPLIIWGTLDWGTLVGLPVAFWLLLGVTFLISTLTQFFAPAEQAIIPLIVEKKEFAVCEFPLYHHHDGVGHYWVCSGRAISGPIRCFTLSLGVKQ